MLSNTISLVPKLVEIQMFLLRKRFDIDLITETKLNDNISDSIAHFDGYNLHPKDRLIKQYGGVCPRANGAERRSGRKPEVRVLIPPGYLHQRKRMH
jgi:hypothetical protein